MEVLAQCEGARQQGRLQAGDVVAFSPSAVPPLGVVRSVGSWATAVEPFAHSLGLTAADVMWVTGPVWDGLFAFVAWQALQVGAQVVLRRESPQEATVVHTSAVGVGTVLGLVREGVCTGVHTVVVLGEPCGARVRQEAAVLGVRVVEVYAALPLGVVGWAECDGPLVPFPGVSWSERGGRVWVDSPYVARCALDAQQRSGWLVDAWEWHTVGDGVLMGDGGVGRGPSIRLAVGEQRSCVAGVSVRELEGLVRGVVGGGDAVVVCHCVGDVPVGGGVGGGSWWGVAPGGVGVAPGGVVPGSVGVGVPVSGRFVPGGVGGVVSAAGDVMAAGGGWPVDVRDHSAGGVVAGGDSPGGGVGGELAPVGRPVGFWASRRPSGASPNVGDGTASGAVGGGGSAGGGSWCGGVSGFDQRGVDANTVDASGEACLAEFSGVDGAGCCGSGGQAGDASRAGEADLVGGLAVTGGEVAGGSSVPGGSVPAGGSVSGGEVLPVVAVGGVGGCCEDDARGGDAGGTPRGGGDGQVTLSVWVEGVVGVEELWEQLVSGLPGAVRGVLVQGVSLPRLAGGLVDRDAVTQVLEAGLAQVPRK